MLRLQKCAIAALIIINGDFWGFKHAEFEFSSESFDTSYCVLELLKARNMLHLPSIWVSYHFMALKHTKGHLFILWLNRRVFNLRHDTTRPKSCVGQHRVAYVKHTQFSWSVHGFSIDEYTTHARVFQECCDSHLLTSKARGMWAWLTKSRSLILVHSLQLKNIRLKNKSIVVESIFLHKFAKIMNLKTIRGVCLDFRSMTTQRLHMHAKDVVILIWRMKRNETEC